jgi:hypothetical protein
MQTSTPLAGVSLGQAILTWTRQALTVSPDKATAIKLGIIIFNFIRVSILWLPKPLDSETASDHHSVILES